MKSLFSTAAVLLVSLVNVSQGVPTLFPRANSSDDLGSWIDSETTYSNKGLLANINPDGAVKGFIAASPSTSNPVCIMSSSRYNAGAYYSVLLGLLLLLDP